MQRAKGSSEAARADAVAGGIRNFPGADLKGGAGLDFKKIEHHLVCTASTVDRDDPGWQAPT